VKINVYSFQEMEDKHLLYGSKNGNSKEVRELQTTFSALDMKFQA
jgi:hypothetical protein